METISFQSSDKVAYRNFERMGDLARRIRLCREQMRKLRYDIENVETRKLLFDVGKSVLKMLRSEYNQLSAWAESGCGDAFLEKMARLTITELAIYAERNPKFIVSK